MQPERARELFQKQRLYFKSGQTRPAAFRREQLRKFISLVRQYEPRFIEALGQDLRRDAYSAYLIDLGPFYHEADYLLKHFKLWMQPVRVDSPLFLLPGKAYQVPEPKGVTLHISPWNYPCLLLFNGLAAAIVAGCTMVVKPSELAPSVALLVEEMINGNFPEEYMHVVNGDGASVVPVLMQEGSYDHVIYTGSTAVGKKIMELAARTLTSVTLELGGKSPCIVDETANLEVAARRIVWGKLLNAGQTCIAPDYILVEQSVRPKLLDLLKKYLQQYCPDPRNNTGLCRIVNRRQYDRILRYLGEGRVVYGGQAYADELVIEPTLLTDVAADDAVMQEEIFGPVLPVIGYKTMQDIESWIDLNPHPLALYVFSSRKSFQDHFINRVPFGGCTINDTIAHISNSDLPFGGVRNSGIGAYHGKSGFDAFTHYKSVQKQNTWLDPSVRYAPNVGWKARVWRWLLG